MAPPPPIDLSKPRWDQNSYIGRAKHFFMLTNPFNILASDQELEKAKKVVDEVKRSRKLPEGCSADQIWKMKYLVDSAFHPDTGEKMILIGRMSAQMPMNTIITGGMITFYKTTGATVFWQWINQTFNAVVNFTNRSGTAPISKTRLLASYLAACGGALGTALYLNNKVKNMKPVYARLVPFAAVCGANFINIPMMRSNEITNGTPVFLENGKHVGESKKAARTGIALVCISRCIMAVPGMTLTPLVTNYVASRGLFMYYPRAFLPFQLGLVCLCVTFATPLCCALFKQQMSMDICSLEPEVRDKALKLDSNVKHVVYNKGL